MTSPPSSASQAVPPTVEHLLEQAIARHQAGELLEAGTLYQTILQAQPDHAEANHNLGVIAVQAQQPAAGLPYLTAALDADPTRAQYWLSYIDALFQADQVDDARAVLAMAQQQGLEGDEVDALVARLRDVPPRARAASAPRPAKPASARGASPSRREIDALVAQFKAGRNAEVAALAKRMTERFPRFELGWKTLGIALQVLGRGSEAIVPLQQAAVLSSGDAEAHYRLGIALHESGRLDEAEASYRQALRLNPDDIDVHNNLGITLQEQGRLQEADGHFLIALHLNPDDARTHDNRANLLCYMGRPKEAEKSYQKAIQLAPGDARIHSSLGKLLRHIGRLDDAKASLQRALELSPDDTDPLNVSILNNLGITLQEQGLLADAETCFRRLLAARPSNVAAIANLGQVFLSQGRLDEAEACFRHALEVKPDRPALVSNLLYYRTLSATGDGQSVFAQHVEFGEKFEAKFKARWGQHPHTRDPERCLKIGFVSADLYNHAVASFIEPVLLHLARDPRLSLHAYYNHVIDDRVTQRLRTYFAHWTPITGVPEAALADHIRADGIDILIDLSGHTAGNRLLTFAEKPAPVQVTWMGYPGTTGMRAIDYYLADRFFLPPGQFDAQFTEKIVYLPANSPYMPIEDAPPVGPLPALDNGHVTFGSFSRPNKLSRAVIALWAQLLRAVPDARMLLAGMPEAGNYDALIAWFEQEGIARERLSFHARCTMDVYLKLHHQVDICLDTFPYNGGTTTLHALWMGVPTLTLTGNTPAGRSGASILGHAGLESFVAHDAADFVEKGVYWSRHLAQLSDIRAGVRDRFARSARGQPALVAAGVERALRTMWQRWCAGLPAESFEVALQDLPSPTQEARHDCIP